MASDFQLKRIDDRSLFKILKKAKEAGQSKLNSLEGDIGGSAAEIKMTFSSALPWTISEEDLQSAPSGQFVISAASLTFTVQVAERNQSRQESVSFQFSRGGNGTLLDKLSISQSSQISAMNKESNQAVQKAIHAEL
ncbi:hypothetical protein [Sulfitobacter sp.]|uniref:hypothetical protein n=1 Tax=Roseobacteraceae TaxID=2854170 RepID=UPI003298232B